MSDAQVPRDVLSVEKDPAGRSAELAGEPGHAAPPDVSDNNTQAATPASAPDAETDSSLRAVILVPPVQSPEQGAAGDEQTSAGEELSSATAEIPGEAPAAPLIETREAPSDVAPDDDGTAPQHSEAEADTPPVPASLAEVSPIFSALDAAEKTAEAAPQSAASLDGAHEPEAAAPPREPGRPDDAPRDNGAHDEHAPAAADAPPPASDQGDVSAAAQSASEEEIVPAPKESQKPPDEILQDAAARIAAEASATAAALENLKRLLVHKLPEPGIGAPPPPHRKESRAEFTAPPPIPAYRPLSHVPITPPPMMPAATALPLLPDEEEPPRRPWAVGSFFAGFALSWVFGAVLYVFLSAG
jgi:hypothetical protein